MASRTLSCTYTMVDTTASRCEPGTAWNDLVTSGCLLSSTPSTESPRSSARVNSKPTWYSAVGDHSPNQSITQRLNSAGDVALRLWKSSPCGFMVKTTCRLRCTTEQKRAYSSSSVSISTASRLTASRISAISVL